MTFLFYKRNILAFLENNVEAYAERARSLCKGSCCKRAMDVGHKSCGNAIKRGRTSHDTVLHNILAFLKNHFCEKSAEMQPKNLLLITT